VDYLGRLFDSISHLRPHLCLSHLCKRDEFYSKPSNVNDSQLPNALPSLGCGHFGEVVVDFSVESDFGHGEALFLAGVNLGFGEGVIFGVKVFHARFPL